MAKNLICCGILKNELSYIFKNNDVKVTFIEAALHVDYEKMAESLTQAAEAVGGNSNVFVIGNECHPKMDRLIADKGKVVQARNCIEMLLGEKMAQFDAEARTFYLTPGLLENWKKVFIEGLKWDSVEARLKFGYYERILFLDTGVVPIDDEKILEFFEFTQVPIEITQVSLEHLKTVLADTMR